MPTTEIKAGSFVKVSVGSCHTGNVIDVIGGEFFLVGLDDGHAKMFPASALSLDVERQSKLIKRSTIQARKLGW